MNKKNIQRLQVIFWEDIRDTISTINPELFKKIDSISPDKNYPLLKVRYYFEWFFQTLISIRQSLFGKTSYERKKEEAICLNIENYERLEQTKSHFNCLFFSEKNSNSDTEQKFNSFHKKI